MPDAEFPSFLYRYRPLRPTGSRSQQRVIDDELKLLPDGHIWVSNPHDLNDPFDCRPIYAPSQKAVLDEMMGRLLIGSLSAVAPDEVNAGPMWCYYANNHRGVCVEYPLDRSAAIKLPIYKVRYGEPRLDISKLSAESFRISSPMRLGVALSTDELGDASNNIPVEEMTRKSAGWALEQEWRIIWPANIQESDGMRAENERRWGASHANRFFVAKPRRVILGANMRVKLRTELAARIRLMGLEAVVARLSSVENRIELASA